jgi:hypothetical protein
MLFPFYQNFLLEGWGHIKSYSNQATSRTGDVAKKVQLPPEDKV